MGKPTVWITFGDNRKLLGGEFKFRDFFEGIGKTKVDPVVVDTRLDYSAFDQVARSWQPMSWDPVPLMNAFPYQTQLWKENTSKAAAYFGSAPF